MEATFNQHIGIFENAFQDSWCDEVISQFELNNTLLKTRDQYWGSREIADDISLNLDQIEDSTLSKKLLDHLNKTLIVCWENYYQQKYPFSHGDFVINGFKVQKTLPTGGYHVWHSEYPTHVLDEFKDLDYLTRFGVYTIYLNDVEEGGETEFRFQSLRVPPKKGTLCFFPAGYTHIHRGNPPLSGEKYIVTGWLNLANKYHMGDNFKKPNITPIANE